MVVGLLSCAEAYATQLIWRASQPFPDVNTAYSYVVGRMWVPLFTVVNLTLLLANFGSGMGAQIGAARLLFGMGRSNALPKSFFGVVDEKHRIPRNNVFVVGGFALVAAFLLEVVAGYRSYIHDARALNLGIVLKR